MDGLTCRELDAAIKKMPTPELEGMLMQHGIDNNPNLIENDIRFQEARRQGDVSRGILNLGTSGGYPVCDPNEPVSRSSWWLVAAGVAIVGVAIWAGL